MFYKDTLLCQKTERFYLSLNINRRMGNFQLLQNEHLVLKDLDVGMPVLSVTSKLHQYLCQDSRDLINMQPNP